MCFVLQYNKRISLIPTFIGLYVSVQFTDVPYAVNHEVTVWKARQ